MQDTDPSGGGGPGTTLIRLRWPLVVIAVAVLGLLAYRTTLHLTRDLAAGAGRSAIDAGRRLGEIAERFHSGTITQTFVAALPSIEAEGAGRLELATATVTETLSRSDERRMFWDLVSLGETVSEIRVPVTYRYYVSLSDPWTIEIEGQTCLVRAPGIRPSLPPAIDTSGMQKRTANGWLRWNAADQLAELERSLTPTLETYARDPRHLDLAREHGRRTVAEFVRSWLLREDHWRADRFRSIVVVFADETLESAPFPAPTLELTR